MNSRSRKQVRLATVTGCILLGLLTFMLSAAGEYGAAQGLQLAPPWEVGESSRLEVRRGETLLATWDLRVEEKDGQTVLVSEQKAEGYREYAAVSVDPESLVPSRIDFEVESSQGRVTYTGLYGDKDVVIKAQTPGGPQEAKVKLPAPPYFDNEETVMLLRALPLATGFKVTINDIVTRAVSKAAITLQVVRKESVTVPAGTYEAWVVEIKGTSQFAWVSTAAPHELVKYENKQAGTVSVLVEYRRR